VFKAVSCSPQAGLSWKCKDDDDDWRVQLNQSQGHAPEGQVGTSSQLLRADAARFCGGGVGPQVQKRRNRPCRYQVAFRIRGAICVIERRGIRTSAARL
jgi:hypothetical protein